MMAGHWDMQRLALTPDHETVPSAAGLQAICYAGEPFQGHATRVFAYLGVPETPPPWPGVVLVHGGGGTAFAEWVRLWTARGYAALAMDLAGCGPQRQPLPDGGPGQDNETKLLDPTTYWEDHWIYHSVAAILRAHSLLAAVPGVDSARIALTGISWGAILTFIVAGLDRRFVCAVPVYGRAFLDEGGAMQQAFAELAPTARRHWREYCDPAAYLGKAALPILFIASTNDIHSPLDAYQRTYRLVRGARTLSIRRGMQHGHPAGWAPAEIALFTDHWLRGAPALPTIGEISAAGKTFSAPIWTERPLVSGTLLYTTDRTTWPDRVWQEAPATISVGQVSGLLPANVSAYFLAVTDAEGAYVSSPHVTDGD
ncbi:MAG TPA: acetylxylan esterase [Chloroflexota bacterium]